VIGPDRPKTASLTAEYYLMDLVAKDCPPSVEKVHELKDAISVLAHAVFDLESRKDAAEDNLTIAQARIAELEGDHGPIEVIAIAMVDEEES
jgi:hypothetical protein